MQECSANSPSKPSLLRTRSFLSCAFGAKQPSRCRVRKSMSRVVHSNFKLRCESMPMYATTLLESLQKKPCVRQPNTETEYYLQNFGQIGALKAITVASSLMRSMRYMRYRQIIRCADAPRDIWRPQKLGIFSDEPSSRVTVNVNMSYIVLYFTAAFSALMFPSLYIPH